MAKRNSAFPLRALAALLLTLVLLPISGASNTRAQEKGTEKAGKTYTFVSYTTARVGEVDRIKIIEQLELLMGDIYEKTGIRIIYKQLGDTDVSGSFEKAKADIAYLGIEDVVRLDEKKIQLEPLVFLSMFNRPGARVCLYAEGKYADIDSLNGTTVNFFSSNLSDVYYIGIRKVMMNNSINIPFADYFGDVYKIPDVQSSFQALLLGKISALINTDWNYELYAKNLPGIEKINTVACTREYPVFGIYVRKGFDKNDAEKFKEYAKKVHKSPLLKEFRTILIALNAKFVDPDPVLIERYKNLFNDAKKNGWFEEARNLREKMEKIEFGQALKKERKTYQECKEECKTTKDQMECVDKCMGE